MDELKTNLDEVQDGISQELEEMGESTLEQVEESEIGSEIGSEEEIETDSEIIVEKSTKSRKTKTKVSGKKGAESQEISSDDEKTVSKSKTSTKTKGNKGAKAPTYTVEECGKNARQLGTSREVVLIALREAGKKESDLVSYAEAKVIIRTFLKREVL